MQMQVDIKMYESIYQTGNSSSSAKSAPPLRGKNRTIT